MGRSDQRTFDVYLVDHALSRAFYKGALGAIVVSGEENPELFRDTTSEEGAT